MSFSNSDDVIDSRDVIARIEELEGEIELEETAIQDQIDEKEEELRELKAQAAELGNYPETEESLEEAEELDLSIETLTDEIGTLKVEKDDTAIDEKDELAKLKALQEEAEGYSPDWTYGATLIREDYFEEYARQLADDIGAIDRKANWPLNCIDWEQAANELKHDYTEVDFDGVAYYVR